MKSFNLEQSNNERFFQEVKLIFLQVIQVGLETYKKTGNKKIYKLTMDIGKELKTFKQKHDNLPRKKNN
jgi:hypothetical protein